MKTKLKLLKLFWVSIILCVFSISCEGCKVLKKSVHSERLIFTKNIDNQKNLSINPSNSESIDKIVISKNKLAIILFYINSCPYCKKFIPNYKKLANQYMSKPILFGAVKLNEDYFTRLNEKKEIYKYYGIKIDKLPAIIIIKDGTEIERINSNEESRKLSKIKEKIDKYI